MASFEGNLMDFGATNFETDPYEESSWGNLLRHIHGKGKAAEFMKNLTGALDAGPGPWNEQVECLERLELASISACIGVD